MKMLNVRTDQESFMLTGLSVNTHGIASCSFTVTETGSYELSCQSNTVQHVELIAASGDTVTKASHPIPDKHGATFQLAHTLLKDQVYRIEFKAAKEAVLVQNFIDTNLVIKRISEPDMKYFRYQWALLNKRTGYDINILPVWQYTKGEGVSIGIADTGVNYKHVNLKGTVDLKRSYNFLHDMRDILPIDELNLSDTRMNVHGTHIAGVINASEDFKQGIIGVAPLAKVVSLKILGSRIPDHPIYRQATDAFVRVIAYAKENDIKIINCSFGGQEPSMVEKAAMLEAKELLFVIAAGNKGRDLNLYKQYPACYNVPNSIVVAATDHNGALFENSNYGAGVDIGAPGYKIIGAFKDDEYVLASATSIAAGFVSGVCGLVWAVNPNLTAEQVKEKVISSTCVTHSKELEGLVGSSGIVNAYQAVSKALRSKNAEVTHAD